MPEQKISLEQGKAVANAIDNGTPAGILRNKDGEAMIRLNFATLPKPTVAEVTESMYLIAKAAFDEGLVGNPNVDLEIGEKAVYPVTPIPLGTDPEIIISLSGSNPKQIFSQRRKCLRFKKIERIQDSENNVENKQLSGYIDFNLDSNKLMDGSKTIVKSGQVAPSQAKPGEQVNGVSELMLRVAFWINANLREPDSPYLMLDGPEPTPEQVKQESTQFQETPAMPEFDDSGSGRPPSATAKANIENAGHAPALEPTTPASPSELDGTPASPEPRLVGSCIHFESLEQRSRFRITVSNSQEFGECLKKIRENGYYEGGINHDPTEIAKRLMNRRELEPRIQQHGPINRINTDDLVLVLSDGKINRDNTSVYEAARKLLYYWIQDLNRTWEDRNLNQQIVGEIGSKPVIVGNMDDVDVVRVNNWYVQETTP